MTVALRAYAKLGLSEVSLQHCGHVGAAFQGPNSNMDYNDFTQMNPI
jgi:hypothetical protein